MGSCDISVIIPLKNEEENVEPLYEELTDVLKTAGLDYEVIVVDDGSKDETLKRLRRVATHDPRITIIQLRRNFGQTPALAAGIEHSRGLVIVPMDGDLQKSPG
jgi:glycosyltransferase involved in cell wall biosynthesis